MKQLSSIVFIVLVSIGLNAQSNEHFSHFKFLKQKDNPAFTAIENQIEAVFVHRSQWTNLTSASLNTQAFNFAYPLLMYNSGVGLDIVNDNTGLIRNTAINLNYSYQLPLGSSKLSFGAKLGLIQASLRGNELLAPQGDYENGLNHNDVLLPDSKVSGLAPDMAVGVYFYASFIQFGVAVDHLLNSNANLGGGLGNVRQSRNLNLIAANRYELGTKMVLEPSVQYQTDLVKGQFDINLINYVKSKYWFGMAYRGYSSSSNDAFTALFGIMIKAVEIGYSYDLNTSFLSDFNGGSHEIMLRYSRMKAAKNRIPPIIYNPRY